MPEERLGLPHLILPYVRKFESFQRPGGGGRPRPSWVSNRADHAASLSRSLSVALDGARREMDSRTGKIPPNANGYYLTVKSRPKEPLLVEQLESKRAGVELLSVEQDPEDEVTTAHLFVPETAQEILSTKIEQYRTEESTRGEKSTPRNRNLIDGIESFAGARLRDLWIDPPSQFPKSLTETHEWEIWLRPQKGAEFLIQAERNEIEVGALPLSFPEDTVYWARCSLEKLQALNDTTLTIARLGRAKINSSFPVSGALPEQWLSLDKLLADISIANDENIAVCVLDTGVGLHHPLLDLVVSQGDCFAYDPNWGITDDHGHGTKMVGLSLFGDLHTTHDAGLNLTHGVESVKIHPPNGVNAHDLLGLITAGSIARAEIASPERSRVFCLATSTDQDTPHRGRPTSWSAELDQLAVGADGENAPKRLLCVSVGNIRQIIHMNEYGALNDLSEVESPSQSWNALSIGATTSKSDISNPSYVGWTPMAPSGDLSPTSRTSTWNKSWPIKPDFVMEGGNLGVDPADSHGYGIDELLLATVSNDYPSTLFESVAETSAATACASRLAARVMSSYSALWPETIRALLIDSCYWNPSMLSLLGESPNKTTYRLLLRRYGFGTPDENRALESVSNDLTMIEECDMQPFIKQGGGSPKLNQMKTFEFPWPQEVLESLGPKSVRMKVTLSYFIEPNPAEGARNRPARYASHGFRFAVKLPDEDLSEFKKRINKAAREEETPDETHASDKFWKLGPQVRDRGCIHSDVWEGPASDLSRRGVIAVYPVGGWWKERVHLARFNDRARFSLVVRLEAFDTEIDLYTPVATQLEVLIASEAS